MAFGVNQRGPVAAPSRRGDDILRMQNSYLGDSAGLSASSLSTTSNKTGRGRGISLSAPSQEERFAELVQEIEEREAHLSSMNNIVGVRRDKAMEARIKGEIGVRVAEMRRLDMSIADGR